LDYAAILSGVTEIPTINVAACPETQFLCTQYIVGRDTYYSILLQNIGACAARDVAL